MISIQGRTVDALAEIVLLEGRLVGFVETIGIEFRSPIRTVRDLHRYGAHLLEQARIFDLFLSLMHS